MNWTPDSWNTCPKCKNAIDADDVSDGSEVRCLGCRTVYAVAVSDDKAWLYEADNRVHCGDVTHTELVEAERLDRAATSGPWTHIDANHLGILLGDGAATWQSTEADTDMLKRARTLLPRFARGLRTLLETVDRAPMTALECGMAEDIERLSVEQQSAKQAQESAEHQTAGLLDDLGQAHALLNEAGIEEGAIAERVSFLVSSRESARDAEDKATRQLAEAREDAHADMEDRFEELEGALADEQKAHRETAETLRREARQHAETRAELDVARDEADGLRKHLGADGIAAYERAKERDAACADAERLTKIADAWQALAKATHAELQLDRHAQNNPGHDYSARLHDAAMAVHQAKVALRALGIDPGAA